MQSADIPFVAPFRGEGRDECRLRLQQLRQPPRPSPSRALSCVACARRRRLSIRTVDARPGRIFAAIELIDTRLDLPGVKQVRDRTWLALEAARRTLRRGEVDDMSWRGRSRKP